MFFSEMALFFCTIVTMPIKGHIPPLHGAIWEKPQKSKREYA